MGNVKGHVLARDGIRGYLQADGTSPIERIERVEAHRVVQGVPTGPNATLEDAPAKLRVGGQLFGEGIGRGTGRRASRP